ncbi:hypothetical protein [Nocardia sp. CC227C]|uniref:hypothetical protein n=1 Tax=Nocardia sp. CC227C TaxID=3044562 RepID=UPI00278BF7BD|nr:hypothetical protein [Nocardia sp. CC227C]
MRILLRTGVLALGIGAAAALAGPAVADIPLVEAPSADIVVPDARTAPIDDDMCSSITGSFGKDYEACM